MNNITNEMKKFISKIIQEETLRITEDTDLISIVVKTQNEKIAHAVVAKLKSKGIRSRAKDSIKFDPFNKTERKGWGVLVRPSDIKAAADELKGYKGLIFDPYVHIARK